MISFVYVVGYSVRVIPCKSSVNSLSISENDGNLCATAHLDKCIRFWDVRSGAMVQEVSGVHTQQATCAQFSMDGTQVITASRDNTLALIDSEFVLIFVERALTTPFASQVV